MSLGDVIETDRAVPEKLGDMFEERAKSHNMLLPTHVLGADIDDSRSL